MTLLSNRLRVFQRPVFRIRLFRYIVTLAAFNTDLITAAMLMSPIASTTLKARQLLTDSAIALIVVGVLAAVVCGTTAGFCLFKNRWRTAVSESFLGMSMFSTRN